MKLNMADDTQKGAFLEGLGRNFTLCLDGLLESATIEAKKVDPTNLSAHRQYIAAIPYEEGQIVIDASVERPTIVQRLARSDEVYLAKVFVYKPGKVEEWTPPSPRMIFTILGNRYSQQEQRRETAKTLQGGIV